MADKQSNTIRYVRRLPREAYGHEEAEIILAVDPEVDLAAALLGIKEDVLSVLGQDADEKIMVTEPDHPVVEDEYVPNKKIDFGDLDDLEEEEEFEDDADDVDDELNKEDVADDQVIEESPAPVPQVEDAPKKKRGRPKKVDVAEPVKTEDDEESIEIEDEYKPKARVRTATTVFDTKNKSHQSLVRDVFSDILPKWNQIAKPKLKEITTKLNDTDLLDGEGDVLKSFREQAKKLLLKAQA